MALRNQQTLEVTDIVLRDKVDGNALASGPEGGALENFYIDQGKLVRAAFMPPFHTSVSDNSIWAMREFNFTRDNAPEQQLLVFKSDGRVYKRAGGQEHIIYPPNDVASAASVSDDGYAGTGAAVAGDGTNWTNAGNITGTSDTTYAVSAATGQAGTSSGPLYTGTVSSASDGNVTWVNPSNATADDGSSATVSLAPEENSDSLRCSNFGFAIPSAATIDGIVIAVKCLKNTGSTTVRDLNVYARSGGSQRGSNLAIGVLPTSLSYQNYGGSSNLLGTTWTPAQINSSDFGADFQVVDSSSSISAIVSVDAVRITVYYTTASAQSTDVLKATNYGFLVEGTITGITVKIRGKVVASSGSPDSTVTAQLIGASGSAVGGVRTRSLSSASDVTLTFGGTTDPWASSWVKADIQNSNFGVQFYCTKSASPAGTVTFSIDSVYILVETSSGATQLFTGRPGIAQIANRLHVSDGRLWKIWNGWEWADAGLAAPTGFDSTDTSLTGTGLTGTYKVAVTAVDIRSNGSDVRVHESNRSDFATEAPANQSIRVDISGVTFPSRATHWSVYLETPAGSGVLRRVATNALAVTTYDIAAEPAATAAVAPERNDPVQPSRIMVQWKNRLACRSETNPDEFWFTAFGEVAGLLNGAGEECLPGRLGVSATLSDLTNSWRIPDGGQPMQAACYHDENLWIFTDRTGFVIQGDGALLDDTGLRDFRPQRALPFGAAGPNAALSTPFGLVVVSPEHKMWLRHNDGSVSDIGKDIQSRLDALTEDELNDIEMVFWSGEGWDWLLVPLQDRIGVFDFALRTERSLLGGWTDLGSQDALPQPTALAVYRPNKKFLLSGHADGSVHQIAALCQPAHLGLSCNLGETYFGSSVQNSPVAIARTGPIAARGSLWSEWKYVQFYHYGHTDTDSISTSNPTVTAYYDQTNPAAPSSGVSLTVGLVGGSNERRAWFRASSTASSTGALARRTHVELKWTGTDTDGASRPQLVNNEVAGIAIANQPKRALTQ